MRLRRLLPLASLLALACDDHRPPPGPIPVHPVSGRVTYKGKPVPGALVAFHPVAAPATGPAKPGEAGPPRPTGKTDADGNFKLHSYVGDDGAPAGDYKVSVALAGSAETRNIMAKDASKTPNTTLPPRYADPGKSDLTATVGDGDNALAPFDLK